MKIKMPTKMQKAVHLKNCPLCGKKFGNEECIWVPMNFTGLWQLFKTHKKCEEKHKREWGGGNK